ncbi:MAG: hypothetical protein ACK41T_11020, partial [Pseudobdellovibrio sp.]
MKNINPISCFFLIFFFVFNVSAQSLNLAEGLIIRNQVDIQHRKLKSYLMNELVKEKLTDWLSHPANNKYVVDCQFKLRPYFHNPLILGYICYLSRQDQPQRSLLLEFVKRYYLEVGSALYELQNDPRYTSIDQA